MTADPSFGFTRKAGADRLAQVVSFDLDGTPEVNMPTEPLDDDETTLLGFWVPAR